VPIPSAWRPCCFRSSITAVIVILHFRCVDALGRWSRLGLLPGSKSNQSVTLQWTVPYGTDVIGLPSPEGSAGNATYRIQKQIVGLSPEWVYHTAVRWLPKQRVRINGLQSYVTYKVSCCHSWKKTRNNRTKSRRIISVCTRTACARMVRTLWPIINCIPMSWKRNWCLCACGYHQPAGTCSCAFHHFRPGQIIACIVPTICFICGSCNPTILRNFTASETAQRPPVNKIWITIACARLPVITQRMYLVNGV
jgi:hypothetical protein